MNTSDLSLAHVEGSNALLNISGLDEPTNIRSTVAANICNLGFNGLAHLDVLDGALFECQFIKIGVNDGSSGTVTVGGALAGHPARMLAHQGICVGGDGLCLTTNGVPGELSVQRGGVVETPIMLVASNGELAGNGNLEVDDLIVKGLVAPGLASQVRQGAASLPGALAISGTVVISPTGTLAFDITGSDAGEQDSLVVTGTVALSGTLALNFGNGYAPKQGDLLTLVKATGGTSGAFANITIVGLEPGFDFELEIVNGELVMTALNDGVSTTQSQFKVYLPLVRR